MVWLNQRNALMCDQRADLHITQRCEGPDKVSGASIFSEPNPAAQEAQFLGY
jgi:hypothetical protein